MILYLIGVNYKYAPYILHSKICREKREIADFWNNRALLQSAILKTCNRLEIYASANNVGEYWRDVKAFKETFRFFFVNAYMKVNKKDMFLHGLRLAVGLDSQLKGELQILEQIKAWIGYSSFPQVLNDFWQEVLPLAEEIRQESGLNKKEHNIASITFEDLLEMSDHVNKQKIVVVGTGRIAELFADFRPPSAELYFAAHKNYEKARYLARKTGGAVISLKDIAHVLKDADALVSATSSPHTIFNKNDFDEIISGRDKPLYVYDLALTYDVEPEVGKLNGVILKNLNGSDELFKKHTTRIKRNIQYAEYLAAKVIDDHKEEFGNYDFKSGNETERIGYQAS